MTVSTADPTERESAEPVDAVHAQNSTRATLLRRPSAVIGGQFTHPGAPENDPG